MQTPGGLAWAIMLLLAAAAVAYVLAALLARLAQRALVAVTTDDRPLDPGAPELRRLIRVVRWTGFIALLAIFGLPALRLAGVDPHVGLSPQMLSDWLFGSGLRIVVIVIASYVLTRISAVALNQLEARVAKEIGPDVIERARRTRTLGRLLTNTATILVVTIATLMVLRELHIDITPILTGAGILGLAVGFGGQTLVRDLISGFFLIVENQIRVGDGAIINGTSGLVEEINLRTVVLRDAEGAVHVFPNGAITQLANRSKEFSYYVTDIGVSYRNDIDAVMDVLRGIGDEMMGDPRYRVLILEPMEILGVEALRDTQVNIRLRIRTLPLKQWEVGRELLRRIKKAFDVHHIEIPSPHQPISIGAQRE
jgi:small-conductance mechanosensitive channel